VTVCRSGLDDDYARKRLPPSVYDLALRLGADPRRKQPTVRLGQTGRMRQVGASQWMAFRAEQTISNLHCAFDWRARTGAFGLVSVRDALTEDGGRLDVRALGFIPIARAIGSPALARGELMRYLAELAWAPDAILRNTELRWREDEPDTLVVGAGSSETAAEVVLNLDNEGRISGAFAPDRPRSVKAPFLPTPWRGRFSDYRRHHTMWLPFAAEVAWVIDGEEAVYWQGEIERWES
jgi:hypothetical protein